MTICSQNSWAEIVDYPSTFNFRSRNTQADGLIIASLATTSERCVFVFPHRDDRAFRSAVFERLGREDSCHWSSDEESEHGRADPRGEKGKDFEDCVICGGEFLFDDYQAHSEKCLEEEAGLLACHLRTSITDLQDIRVARNNADKAKKEQDDRQRRLLLWTKRSVQVRRPLDEPFDSVLDILDNPPAKEDDTQGSALPQRRSQRLQSAGPSNGPAAPLLSDTDSDIVFMPAGPAKKSKRATRGASEPIEQDRARSRKRRAGSRVVIEADPLPPSTVGKKPRSTRTARAARAAAYQIREEEGLLREMGETAQHA